MTDFDQVGRVLSTRASGLVPLKFFCSCRALLNHAKVSESEIDTVWNLGRDKKVAVFVALGISMDSKVLLPFWISQMKSFSLSKGTEYALQHPNASLRYLLDPSISSDLRRKYADPIMKGFSLAYFDISDEFILLDLIVSASKSIVQSARVIYLLYIHNHLETVRMLMKTYDIMSADKRGRNVLHFAARDGNKDALCWFIENGGDINAVDAKDWSPLSYALRYGHASAVTFLLEMMVNSNTLIDSSGNSLLHLACMSGSLEVVKILWDFVQANDCLMKDSIGKDHVNVDGMNCLHTSAKYGHWGLVEWCLENRFDPNKLDLKGMSPLHHAAAADSALSITALHAGGATYPTPSLDRDSPLFIAVRNRRVDIIVKLVDLYDLQSELSSAFDLALSLGFSEVVHEFLKKDSTVLKKGTRGDHPFSVAVVMRNVLLVRVLLQYAEYCTNKVLANCFTLSFKFKDMEILNDLSSVLRERSHKATDISPIFHLLTNNLDSLLEIIAKGDCADLLGFALDCGINLEGLLSKEESTFLAYAENRKHSRMVNMLICRELDIEKLEASSTLIHVADVGHLTFLELLLKFRTNVNAPDDSGRTALMAASEKGHLSCINVLLNGGANANAVNKSGKSSLMLASEKGHTSCVELLLKKGASVNSSTSIGQTSLMLACEGGHASCVELLLKGGADVDASMKDGWTALMCAVECAHSLCVELLLRRGAEMNLHAKINSSLSSTSSSEEKSSSADGLRWTSGPDVNAVNAFGKSLLMRASQNGHSSCMRLLMKFGADVNLADEDGWTSLMLASLAGHNSCVELLLRAEADVNASSDSGWTALICASQYGHWSCVDALLSQGADVTASTKDGWTALMCASHNGHWSCIDVLLKGASDVNASSTNGWTSLMLASHKGFTSCVELLLNSGANVNAADKHGMTSLMSATQMGHTACIKLLKKFGARS